MTHYLQSIVYQQFVSDIEGNALKQILCIRAFSFKAKRKEVSLLCKGIETLEIASASDKYRLIEEQLVHRAQSECDIARVNFIKIAQSSSLFCRGCFEGVLKDNALLQIAQYVHRMLAALTREAGGRPTGRPAGKRC